MDVQEVAEMLNRSVQMIRRYARHEGLPHRREGRNGRMMFDPAEVREWAAREEIRAMLAFGERVKGRAPQPAA
jgi:DNA-binding transcriptional MerR regulator